MVYGFVGPKNGNADGAVRRSFEHSLDYTVETRLL